MTEIGLTGGEMKCQAKLRAGIQKLDKKRQKRRDIRKKESRRRPNKCHNKKKARIQS